MHPAFITSYDSGYEHSPKHWLNLRRLVAEAEANSQKALPDIRDHAYELYEQRGREPGHDLDDWLCAEAEVLAGFGAAA